LDFVLASEGRTAEQAGYGQMLFLADTAIEEILRWTTPVTHVLRTATADARIGDRVVRGGERVVLWNASANRDERVFADPFGFDVSRKPNDHVGFGYGDHFCLGASLAKLALRVMLEELWNRLPTVELDGPVERQRSAFVAGIKHLPVRFMTH
jgi:cytochrome P450